MKVLTCLLGCLFVGHGSGNGGHFRDETTFIFGFHFDILWRKLPENQNFNEEQEHSPPHHREHGDPTRARFAEHFRALVHGGAGGENIIHEEIAGRRCFG